MNRTAVSQFRRAGVAAPQPDGSWSSRWYGRLLLLLLSAGLLSAAFAPADQFYLAWVGLVPWLLVVNGTRRWWSAFFWSWVGGTFFFIANMWWISFVTAWGMVGLMALLGLYWGLAGVILWGAQLLGEKNRCAPDDPSIPTNLSLWLRLLHRPLLRIILIAAVWVGAEEWFRGTWPWQGLPWLYLGHTQSPALWICQIADITGVAGISFLLVMSNAWIALWILNRLSLAGLKTAGIAILAAALAITAYGLWRIHTEVLRPGPTIAVVQPNYPQSLNGQKGAGPVEMLRFHLDQMRGVLAARAADGEKPIDLCVWSETMMPPLDTDALHQYRPGVDDWTSNTAHLAYELIDAVGQLAAQYQVAVLSGGEYWADFQRLPDRDFEPANKRNAAYFFDRSGQLSPLRYDKIHLVPFGEFMPFRYGFPPLYRLLLRFGPPDMAYYSLQSGNPNDLTRFDLPPRPGSGNARPWRLVTPICFEDIDAPLCARMFRPDTADPDHKRADVLVNLTNDGWFKANENAQHLQAALFRSIENRVPTARSVNTGISGFIDPLGRCAGLLPARTEGTSVGTVWLCSRVSFFTRHGQVFALTCAILTLLLICGSIVQALGQRRPAVNQTSDGASE